MPDGSKGNVGMQAHSAAVKRLRDAHPDEFMGYLKQERIARGLPENPGSQPQTIDDKIAKLQAKIDALRVEAASVTAG